MPAALLAGLLLLAARSGAQEAPHAEEPSLAEQRRLDKEERRLEKEALREERRARAAARRARKRAAQEAEPAEEEEQSESLQKTAGRSLRRATAAGEALKKSLGNPEDAADPGGLAGAAGLSAAAAAAGPAGTAVAPRAAAPRPPPASPSAPKDEKDLLAAARAGYAGAFAEAGLKVGLAQDGASSVTRLDGSPATPQDLKELQDLIRSEPTALIKRPDFYQVLPRERFQDLKKDFRERPELARTDFKHVAVTEGARDFVHSEACEAVTGTCNPHTTRPRYAKGEQVYPEDLAGIWKGVHLTGNPLDPYGNAAAARGAAARPALDARGIRGMFKQLIAGARSFFAGESAPAGAQAGPVFAGAGTWSASPPGASATTAGPGRPGPAPGPAGGSPAEPAASGAPGSDEAAPRGPGLSLTLGGLAAVLALWGLSRALSARD